ncbi:MAG: DegQ family serine endoprotease [Pseudomonadota bacterium]|nr:DegQ family serine endoprotease [Pseudomonadota bacterium]
MKFISLLITLGFLAVSTPVPAQSGDGARIPASRNEIQLSYAPLVKRAAPAVVNIYTKRVVQSRSFSPFQNDPFFKRFFGDNFSMGRSRKKVENSLGSGVIVRSNGLIVTNHHVINKADEITVVLSDRREFDAIVVSDEERTDLAILRIYPGSEKLPVLEMRDSDDLEVGDLVLAIGNPFGVGQTVTSGIISALARSAGGVSDFNFFIQTDAAINPGNSGGALITMDGRLVGINTAIYSRSGGSVGIGFAIPTNMVATVVRSAENGGKIERPWFGASMQDMTTDLAASVGLARPTGVIIGAVYPNGPADRAGLLVGDVILAVNGREIAEKAALNFRIGTLKLGGTARLKILRGGEKRTLTLDLITAPNIPPRNISRLKGRHPFSGSVIANLSPALAEELSIDTMMTGVMILELRPRSPAHRIGLRPGDVILTVNGAKIDRVKKFKTILARPPRVWRVSLRRDGRTLSFAVES